MAWEVRASGGAVQRRGRTSVDDVEIDVDGLDVMLTAGGGHERVDLSCHLPIDVLTTLLDRAGFTLTKKV